MKAFIARKYSAITDLENGDIDKPVAGENEVLIKVKAAAVNPADLMVISGKSGGKFMHANSFPFPVGYDFSGEVEEAGRKVSNLKPGDEVFGFLEYSKKNRQGTIAEYVTAAADTVALKPPETTFVNAASAATAGAAALMGLKSKGNLQPGQRIFINGASGGVGSYAVCIAKNMGAEVWASCSSKNSDYVRSLGADNVLDYKAVNLKELPEKFDLFLDVAARSSFCKTSSILTPGGTFVSLMPMSPGFAIGKLKSLMGSKSCRGVIVKPDKAALTQLAVWMKEDRLDVAIDSSFSLADASAALLKLESGRATGKIAIVVEA
jgi:NADPH:quinone reductase-like Zn-dependent oxidoreductase